MRMKASRHGLGGGFTLIEIMVVIAIIASLVTAGSLMLSIAAKKKMISDTQGRVNAIGAALEQLHDPNQLGRYPPTSLAKLGSVKGFDGSKFMGGANDVNVGIETIFVVFRLEGMSVMPQGVDGEGSVGNTDNDKANSTAGTKLAKSDLMEYLDAWGNPLVYFSSADYKDPSKVETYMLGTGEKIKVAPRKNEKTGEYVRPDSFQLFSMGPDGKPDTDDDIVFGVM